LTSHLPFSDVPRRRQGHPDRRFQRPAGELRSDSHPKERCSTVEPLRPRPPTRLSLAERATRRSGRLPSCHARPSRLGRRAALVSFDREYRAATRTVLTSGPRDVRQHVMRDSPWPASPGRFALRLLADATRDASDQLLPFHPQYEHPRLVSSGRSRELSLPLPPGIACFTSGRRASAGRTFGRVAAKVLVLPLRWVHAEPLAPPSRPSFCLGVCTRQASRGAAKPAPRPSV
jgi:hypothetical protein